jgi:ABC-type multidrug transport system fused ATPase/permease subunit
MLLVTSILFKAITLYFQTRFIHICDYNFSKRVIENYLHQPYSWFLNRNSSDLAKSILSEVGLVVGGSLAPLMDLMSQIIFCFFIFSLLIYVNPIVTINVILIFGISYLFVYIISKAYIKKIGDIRFEQNRLRFITVSESFGAVKELKLSRSEQIYVEKFSKIAKTFAKANAAASLVSQLPRYFFEIIAFGGAVLLILFFMTQDKNLENVLPVVSLYVLAGYRIMPIMQKAYSNLNSLKFYSSALNNFFDDLKSLQKYNTNNEGQNSLTFDKAITLNNISYKYPNSSKEVLKNIHLTIPARKSLGIAGLTGSGKTTFVDIVLSLLNPQKGTLEVDGQVIDKNNIKSWQSCIGYVPQHIYLADDTILANIVFGNKIINIDRIEEVAKIANLHEFVINDLPEKYQTIIGERGVRLSGGQLQRIGIARALYAKPKLLVLDEATSALDNITEHKIIKAIGNLEKDITIIFIAHRFNTIKNCDKVILLNNGELEGQGSFEELKKTNKLFSEMVKRQWKI